MTSVCNKIEAHYSLSVTEPFDAGLSSNFAETEDFHDLLYELAGCHLEENVLKRFPEEVEQYIRILDIYIEDFYPERYSCDIFMEAVIALEFKDKKEMNKFKLTHPHIYREFTNNKVIEI